MRCKVAKKKSCEGSSLYHSDFFLVVFLAAGFFVAALAFALGSALAGFAFFSFLTMMTGASSLRLRVLPYEPIARLPFAVFLSPFPISICL